MAKIFLDTNYFIDLVEQRSEVELDAFEGHTLYISTLSLHILTYVFKYKIPDQKLPKLLAYFNLVSFAEDLSLKSLEGPTADFEDNIQLHSAAAIDADVFLTNDKQILKMKFFGKAKIQQKI